jgi:hypothetical protein
MGRPVFQAAKLHQNRKIMKTYVNAAQVRVGDTLCFANPRHDVTVERITQARANGSIGLHGKCDSWTSFYEPGHRVRILRNEGSHANH